MTTAMVAKRLLITLQSDKPNGSSAATGDGQWAAFAVQLGHERVDWAAVALLTCAERVDTEKGINPSAAV